MEQKTSIPSNMEKISDLRLEPATNGVILSYCVMKKEKSNSKDTYENCRYEYPKEVFDFEDGSSDPEGSAMDKAFSRFRELWMKQYSEYKNKKA